MLHHTKPSKPLIQLFLNIGSNIDVFSAKDVLIHISERCYCGQIFKEEFIVSIGLRLAMKDFAFFVSRLPRMVNDIVEVVFP